MGKLTSHTENKKNEGLFSNFKQNWCHWTYPPQKDKIQIKNTDEKGIVIIDATEIV